MKPSELGMAKNVLLIAGNFAMTETITRPGPNGSLRQSWAKQKLSYMVYLCES